MIVLVPANTRLLFYTRAILISHFQLFFPAKA